jgi:hypothetical protein
LKLYETLYENYSDYEKKTLKISGFRHGVVEAFTLLECYAAQAGSWLLKFYYNNLTELLDP